MVRSRRRSYAATEKEIDTLRNQKVGRFHWHWTFVCLFYRQHSAINLSCSSVCCCCCCCCCCCSSSCVWIISPAAKVGHEIGAFDTNSASINLSNNTEEGMGRFFDINFSNWLILRWKLRARVHNDISHRRLVDSIRWETCHYGPCNGVLYDLIDNTNTQTASIGWLSLGAWFGALFPLEWVGYSGESSRLKPSIGWSFQAEWRRSKTAARLYRRRSSPL